MAHELAACEGCAYALRRNETSMLAPYADVLAQYPGLTLAGGTVTDHYDCLLCGQEGYDDGALLWQGRRRR